MRIFELARELNMPGKALIDRIKAMGMAADGNFNVLDDDTVKKIKAHMLEPVTRVEQDAAPSSEEPEEQPRKRRIISARRSRDVTRIQESLGVSGPLPEDQRTREEVTPPPRPDAEPGEGVEEPAAIAAEAPEVAGDGAVASEPPPVESPAPEAAAEPPPGELAASPPPPAAEPAAERAEVREKHRTAIEEEAKASRPGDKGRWRDFKRGDGRNIPARSMGEEDWIRPSRKRGGGGRPGRTQRRPTLIDGKQRHVFGPRKRAVRIGAGITVSELAGALGVKAREIIKKLMALGVMATINEAVDGPSVELIVADYDVPVEVDTTTPEDLVKEEAVDPATLRPRPPIVTIMGHVDHGKTSLLDFIRSSRIASGEAGGITQHIGAYLVRGEAGDIVFLDTPGHEAFTALRARGADVTDLVVLVVAADDGVMPQTVEAIDHARAADVPIMVALNKIDRPGADQEKIKRQLMEHNLLAEEFGGETVIVPVSATTGDGIPHLLEMIHLQAELSELSAPYEGRARGYVIEAQMDRQRGPVATVIVQRGTLRVGDHFVAGTTFGRVRAMQDEQGNSELEVTPSRPVEVLGNNELPQAGDQFVVVEDEKAARQVSGRRSAQRRDADTAQQRRISLEDFIQGAEREEVTSLQLVVKADAQGSLEALRYSLEKQGNETARVAVVRAGVGGISETDVSLAATTNSVVIGFNVRPDNKAAEQARADGVDVRVYTVIYELIKDVRDSLQGMLKPIIREEVIGHCEVRELFSASKDGRIVGGYITDGRLERNSMVRLFRDDVVIHSGSLNSLRRFKDDVANVAAGYECGVRITNYDDLRVGDLIEAFVKVEEAQILAEPGAGA